MAKTIKESKAIKLYISNIMTEPGQTDNYKLSDHIKAIHSHVGRGVIDYCLADTSDLIPEYVRMYNREGADVVELDSSNVTSEGIKLIKRDLSSSKNGVIRHDADRVAKVIMELICNDLKFKDLQNDTEYLLIESVLKQQKKYLNKKMKESNKNKKKDQKSTKVKTKAKPKKQLTSKFASKYKDRVESIQNSDTQTVQNRKAAEEMEKMQAKLSKNIKAKSSKQSNSKAQVNNKTTNKQTNNKPQNKTGKKQKKK